MNIILEVSCSDSKCSEIIAGWGRAILFLVVLSVDEGWRGLPRLLLELLEGDDLPGAAEEKRRLRRIRKGHRIFGSVWFNTRL